MTLYNSKLRPLFTTIAAFIEYCTWFINAPRLHHQIISSIMSTLFTYFYKNAQLFINIYLQSNLH
jgi:hypothetical protein